MHKKKSILSPELRSEGQRKSERLSRSTFAGSSVLLARTNEELLWEDNGRPLHQDIPDNEPIEISNVQGLIPMMLRLSSMLISKAIRPTHLPINAHLSIRADDTSKTMPVCPVCNTSGNLHLTHWQSVLDIDDKDNWQSPNKILPSSVYPLTAP